MKVLDSDLIIDFLNKVPAAVSKIDELIKEEEELATTVFNEQEVLYGALKVKRKDVIQLTRQYFDSINVLSYDRTCISNVLEIELDLEKKGLSIGTIDELIGGICLAHSAIIVTRNVEHFSRIRNLKVESW